MKHHLSIYFSSLVLVAFLLGGIAGPVSAKRWTPPPAPTVLTVATPKAYPLGEPFQIFAQLHDTKNKPLADRAVDFYIDLTYFGQGRTDINGTVVYQSKKNLPAGEHPLVVSFAGSHDLVASSVNSKLVILPAVVTVQTVPPLAGVSFTMDNREFFSGEDGIARININQVGRYPLTVNTEKYVSQDTRIEFGRWETESYLQARDVDVPTTGSIQVGINIFHQVGQTFVDLDGIPIDKRRITKVTIKSIQGDVFSSTDGAMAWVPASRIARRENGLEVTPLQYSIMNVTVDGSNVVNQAQQKFFVKQNEVWNIALLLYSMRISTHDAFFGSPVGKAVRVEFPNGEVHTYPFDATGTVEIHSLARGIYHIQVIGVKGMVSPTPVALSRNQEAALKVITNQDIAIAGSIGVVIALGLLLVGRPWLLLPAFRHKRHVHNELETEAEGYVSIHNN